MKLGPKNFLYIGYFFILLFAGDRLMSNIIKNSIIEKSQFRYSRMYAQKAKADLVFIGNSRGLCFYQPFIEQLTGKSTFNLSYNGLPSNLAKVLLEDYVQFNGKPKLVIIEASMLARRKEIVATFGCYSSYSKGLENLIYDVSKSMGSFNKLLHLTRYNGEVFQRALYYVGKTDTTLLNDRVISERALNKKFEDTEKLYDTLAIADFKSMVNYCRNENIPFKIVLNPYLPIYRKEMKDVDQFIKELSAGIKAPVLDYSTAIKETNHFADYFHINKNGSMELMQIFTRDKIFEP